MNINDRAAATSALQRYADASQSFADELFGTNAMRSFKQVPTGDPKAADSDPVPVSLGGQNTGGERIFYLVNTGAGTSELQYTAKAGESLTQIAQDVLLAQGVAVEGSYNTLTAAQQKAIQDEATAIAKNSKVNTDDQGNLTASALLKIPKANTTIGVENMQRTVLAADIANQQLLGNAGSWRVASDLADLGTLDFATGNSAEAQKHLNQAVDMIQSGIKNGTIKETADVDSALIETLQNYGTSLANAGKDLHQSNGEALTDRLNADKAYQDAIDLAVRTGQSPYTQASILDKMGANETLIAEDVLNLKGQATFDTYIQKADDHLKEALDLLPIDKSSTSDEIAAKAMIAADLGFEKAHRARTPHDQYANDAASNYQDAQNLWNQVDPGKLSGMDQKTAQNYIDFYLASDLSNYDNLLNSEIQMENDGPAKTTDSQNLAAVEKVLNPLIEKHPEWKVVN